MACTNCGLMPLYAPVRARASGCAGMVVTRWTKAAVAACLVLCEEECMT